MSIRHARHRKDAGTGSSDGRRGARGQIVPCDGYGPSEGRNRLAAFFDGSYLRVLRSTDDGTTWP